jgi:hypothetical protein
MNDKVNEHIAKVLDNIGILPLKTNSDKVKYSKYIKDNIKEYSTMKNDALEEINTRYNALVITPENKEIIKLSSEKLDIDLIRLNHPQINMIDRLNLDYLIYKLTRYYKDDLDNINKIILEIISILKKCGINLTIDDFNYTIYVNEYMKVLLSNYNNRNMIHNAFDSIYWKCPYLITEIALNFRYLIFQNYHKLENNLKKTNVSNIIKDYQDKEERLSYLKRNDYGYLVKSILNKDINFNDYADNNMVKLKANLLLDENSQNNYQNLLDLNSSLYEYNEYLKYQYIVEDAKKLLTDVATYKNLYESKLKEIKSKESKLFSLNKKATNKGLFKIKAEKIIELLESENEIITELDNLYKELDELSIKRDLYLNNKNSLSIYDVLKLASCDYNYFAKLCKEQDENVTINTINDKLFELRSFIIKDHFNIINNIKVVSNLNIAQIIADRYKLANLNITEDSISLDNIESTMDKVSTLITYYDLTKAALNYNTMKFIVNSKKILEDEKILPKM